MEKSVYSNLNLHQVAAETDTFTSERYLQFIRHFRSGTRSVLDIGCATGRGGFIIKKNCPGIKLYGLDVVEERIEKIRKENIYEHLYVASAIQIPCNDNTFDAVVAGEFVEHISPDDFNKVLSELYRVLVKNGKLFLTTPNPKSLLVRLGRNSVLKDPSHLSILTMGELEQKLLLNGFKNIKIKGSGKASRIFGEGFPLMSVYGSYLICSEK